MSNGNDNRSNNSRVFAGLFIVLVGMLFFLRQGGWVIFPYWLFSWPMILIAIGVYVGVKHNFRGSGWLVLLIIGGFFLFDDVLDMYSLRNYLVPAILVAVGAMLIFRPKNGDRWFKKKEWKDADTITGTETSTAFKTTDYAASNDFSTDDSERVDATAIFGAVKKNIVSKNFRGGDATSIFGGSEIDLSKADINGTVKIDITAILGGVKLIVPSHWTVRQDVTAIFGGVDDKRDIRNVITAQNKILVLDGIAFMGGIEISSYR